MSRSARGGLFDPKRIAINALDASVTRQHVCQQLTPMADSTSNIENILHVIERKSFAHQLKKVEIPPIIARVAEILGRVRIEGAKFVSHHGLRSAIALHLTNQSRVDRCSRIGIYGISVDSGRAYSGLMPANLTTLAHFSVSSAISLPKSAGGPGSGVPPRSANRAFVRGSARIALISLLSRSMISDGVALGALMPKKALASYPGTNSPTAGTPGSASERIAVVTASARSLPALICSIEDGRLSNITCPCPARRSISAGPAPR